MKIKYEIWDNEMNVWWKPLYEAFRGRLEDLTLSSGGDFTKRTFDKPAIHHSIFGKDRYESFLHIGLVDRNDVPIIEGHIVKVAAGYGGDNYYKESIGVVKWDAPEFFVASKSLVDDEWHMIEIIGHIKSDPELLK